MTPLQGTVVDTSAGTTIRLSTRATVQIPDHPDLRIGDTCYVLYNYEAMEVREIWTEADWFADEEIEPDTLQEGEDPWDVDADALAKLSMGLSVVSL